MRRAAAQLTTTFALLAGAAGLLLFHAPTATASPHHPRPSAAAARAQAAHQVQRPSQRPAARALIVRATRHAARPSHPARGHQTGSKGRGKAHHAARHSKTEPQRAAAPVAVAFVATHTTAATTAHGAAHRSAARHPSEPAARHGQPAATGSPAGAPNPLQKLAHGLTRLTHSSLLRGPLGWLILAMAVLALIMIAAACATGRGGAGQLLKRALTSAR